MDCSNGACLDVGGGTTGVSLAVPWDRDNDGTINPLDVDDDGDGYTTAAEGGGDNECAGLTRDGIPNYLDRDSDGDGTADADEGAVGADSDLDGLVNRLDCLEDGPDGDQDGDGIPNARETALTGRTDAQATVDWDDDLVPDNEEVGDPGCFEIPAWQRWNDYGIALLRRQQLRQAEEAFKEVERLGHPAGPLNLARVYLAEGRVTQEAPAALRRAREVGDGADDWSLLWFSGLVNKQLGELEAAIDNFQQIVDGGFERAANRGFHFERDYRLLIELADTLYLRGLQKRGPQREKERVALMQRARDFYLDALELDPENADAHYGVRRVFESLGDVDQARPSCRTSRTLQTE